MTSIHPQARSFYLEGNNNTAVLFVHGFTASPSEVYPTAWLLHEVGGYTVSGPLLPGHGKSPEELNRTSWKEWCRAVDTELQEMKKRYDQVFAAGLSMGGLLALYAGIHTPGLSGVVSINAPVIIRFPIFETLAPLLQFIKPCWVKINREEALKLQKQGRYAYDCIPVKAFCNMMQLRTELMMGMEGLKLPLLVMQSKRDESVNPRSASFIAGKACHAKVKLVELPASEHVSTMGPEKELIARELDKFVKMNII